MFDTIKQWLFRGIREKQSEERQRRFTIGAKLRRMREETRKHGKRTRCYTSTKGLFNRP